MFKGFLRTLSLIISVTGAALSVIAGVVDNKRTEITIKEEVTKQVDDRFRKEEEEKETEEKEEVNEES